MRKESGPCYSQMWRISRPSTWVLLRLQTIPQYRRHRPWHDSAHCPLHDPYSVSLPRLLCVFMFKWFFFSKNSYETVFKHKPIGWEMSCVDISLSGERGRRDFVISVHNLTYGMSWSNVCRAVDKLNIPFAVVWFNYRNLKEMYFTTTKLWLPPKHSQTQMVSSTGF